MKVDVTIDLILGSKRPQLFTIDSGATVFEAIQLMAEKNVGALLVYEGSRLMGIVSERDYTRKVAIKGRSSRQTSVREIVSFPIVHASPEHTVEECMRLMTAHKVRHLPILCDEQVLGVVSIGDLVNWLISAQGSAIDQLEHYISGQYPG